MSDRVFTLLILSLTLQDVWSTGLQVWTLLQNSFYDNNSVNVICQHNAQEDWTMGASVFINDTKVCGTEKINTTCKLRKNGNQFNFTLKMTAEQNGLPCYCSVYRSNPIPILLRKGEKMMLFPGCDIPLPGPTNHTDVGNDYPDSTLIALLTWALLGTVILLCFYSLIITVVYIKLRMRICEELKMTYVPMQRKLKAHGADKNAEYMDMREVHCQVRPIRDVNHNSHPNPVGTIV